MAKPYRVTGCFRFFIFIAILAPLAYLGASYYNGQDGIQNLRNIFHKVKDKVSTVKVNNSVPQEKNEADPSSSSEHVTSPPVSNVNEEKLSELKIQVSLKDKEINALIQENLDLKQKLKETDKG
jgi:hypothetical protein